MGDTSRFSNRCPFKGRIKGYVRVVAIAESLLDDLTAFMCAPEHQDIKVDIEERFAKDIVSMVPCEVSRIYVSANQVRIVCPCSTNGLTAAAERLVDYLSQKAAAMDAPT